MTVEDAIEFFGSRAEIARQLEGLRHRSAVYQWDENGLVPLAAALVLANKSKGKLKVNLKVYEEVRQERIAEMADAREDAAKRRKIESLQPVRSR